MNKVRKFEQRVLGSRRLPGLVIALALAVLAAVVALTTLQVREGIRRQIAGRDGEVFHAVTLLHRAETAAEAADDSGLDQGDQMNIVLKSAQLRGVLGVRLFSPEGRFVESFPAEVIEAGLAVADLPALRTLRPVSRFHPRVEIFRLFYPDVAVVPTDAIPVLEVSVPLHAESGGLDGIAQFLVEGHSIAGEYARLDRRLAFQALTAFGAGGAILAATLVWAFHRLQRAHRMLAERTENLARANQELALAAKTSALGTVTAHLLHGLKNPLAGLQNFVAAQEGTAPPGDNSAWQQAVLSTRRMQAMIRQVVTVLHEDQAGTAYEVTLAELEELVRQRAQPLARERGVGFTAAVRADGDWWPSPPKSPPHRWPVKPGAGGLGGEGDKTLPNRVANLVALILINLCENAVQATSRGGTVTLTLGRDGRKLRCEVRDEGGGFPADTPLFMPCRSPKEGGSGIGLALCKQLANHLGAELELASSTAAGCVFTLSLTDPRRAVSPAEARSPKQDQLAD